MIHAGKPHAQVAVAIGVGRHSVQRHVASMHVAPQSPAQAQPASAPLAPGASALDVMRRAVDDLIAIDTSQMSPAAKSAHYDALRRAAESLAKMEPVEPDLGAVDAISVPGVLELLNAVYSDFAADRLTVPAEADPLTVERYRGRQLERKDMKRRIRDWQQKYAAGKAGEVA